jgi:propionate CoA-transferase
LENELNDLKKIVVRRAAMELKKGAFVNLGYGIADGVPIIAKREGIIDDIHFMIEQGALGGLPTTGLNFGAMYNPSAIVDDGYQFDFFHGGGLDMAFLGFAQIDRLGNVNTSRFGSIITGCGGFIDISQHVKKVIYCGSFAVKGKVVNKNGKLKVIHPGKFSKFRDQVQQVTFSGPYALQKKQQILYITERAVFELTEAGLVLTELAPGIHLEHDVLDMMEFRPIIPEHIKQMDQSVFTDGPPKPEGFRWSET